MTVLRCVKCNGFLSTRLVVGAGLQEHPVHHCPNCNLDFLASPAAPAPQLSWEDKVVDLLSEIRNLLKDGSDSDPTPQ